MEFTSTSMRKSKCGKAIVIIDNDMPLGSYHDFIMTEKGWAVDRMVASHKEQEEQAKAAMALPVHESELSACAIHDC